jgi:CBS domain-containing protein
LADLTQLTARDVMRRDFGIVPALFSLHNALITLDRYDCAALPVIDPDGGYRGMISRADAISAIGRSVRPPVVGGMATPLGVWLTTGTLSAGAPPLGLFLSGAMLGLCLFVAYFAMLIPLAFINAEWAALYVSGRLGSFSDQGSIASLGFTLVQGLLFLLAMRVLPLSGIHAAEHQTVWAIERGLPLKQEIVAKMPRAHPRCGTNLLALGGLIQIIFQHLPSIDGATVLFALLFVYLVWRNFGELLQNYLTTKPATPRQLESGIAAGRALLEKYQDEPHVMAPFGARLLRSGMLYSALGMMLVMGVMSWLQNWLSVRILGAL